MYMTELHEYNNLSLTPKQTIPGECLLSIHERPPCEPCSHPGHLDKIKIGSRYHFVWIKIYETTFNNYITSNMIAAISFDYLFTLCLCWKGFPKQPGNPPGYVSYYGGDTFHYCRYCYPSYYIWTRKWPSVSELCVVYWEWVFSSQLQSSRNSLLPLLPLLLLLFLL